MQQENQYKSYLKRHYYNRIKKQIMDNKKVEVSIKKQIDTITIIFDFDGEKITPGDHETMKIINREVLLFKNKVREKLNIELYLKGILTLPL